MQSLQTLGWIGIAAAVTGVTNSNALATIVVNDTWLDGTRTDPTAATYSENGVDSDIDGNLESAWYRAGGGTLDPVAAGGPLRGVMAAAASSSWTTYFTPDASPVTLAAAGDQIKITWVFTTGTVNATNTSQSFRIAIVDSPNASRLVADGAPGSATYAGYALFGNMGQTLGHANPFALMERSAPGTASAFLSSSSSWVSLDDEENTGVTGYADNTQYTYVFTATRTLAGELDLAMSMTGGSVGGDGTLNVSFTDTTPQTFSFDTFGLRPSTPESTATQFDTSLFKVEFVPAPEPASLALLGIGTLAMARRRRV